MSCHLLTKKKKKKNQDRSISESKLQDRTKKWLNTWQQENENYSIFNSESIRRMREW